MEFNKDSRGAQAARDLASAVNGFTNQDLHDFAHQLAHYEHRTLQQSVVRAFSYAIREWAECHKLGQYDARNAQTTHFASWLVDETNKQGVRLFFPMI